MWELRSREPLSDDLLVALGATPLSPFSALVDYPISEATLRRRVLMLQGCEAQIILIT